MVELRQGIDARSGGCARERGMHVTGFKLEELRELHTTRRIGCSPR